MEEDRISLFGERPSRAGSPEVSRNEGSGWRDLGRGSRGKFVYLFGLLLSLLPAAAAPPNVVVIMADDMGWGDLSLHGNTNLNTPNLDHLAAEGAQFDRFFVSPVCSPTRAEFLTGRYHPRSSVSRTGFGGERMDLDEQTIAQDFRRSGYRTGLFGKWHNGTQAPYHPNSRGFDEYFGATTGYMTHYHDPLFVDHNGELVQAQGFIVDEVTERAMSFMADAVAKDEPFFVCLTYHTPHRPMQVPRRFWDRFVEFDLELRARDPEKEDEHFTRAALAMVENLDWNVGRLLAKLVALAVDDNTVVVFFSDNGPDSWRWNGGMKGKKGTTDEGGVRSPLLMRWPEGIRPGTRVRSIAGVIDLRPTLLDLCGLRGSPVLLFDGISLKGELQGSGTATAPDRILFAHWNRRISARTQRFRLDAAGALFDMVTDPGQTRDVSANHPAVAERLVQAVAQWREGVLTEMALPDTRPYPVGHPDAPTTWLFAGEARFHGGVRRSNHYPASSHATHWTHESDALSWKVDVAAGGFFAATLYYACPTGEEGSTIRLSFGPSTVSRSLDLPNDAVVVGPAADIYPRVVAVDKTFRPVVLGALHLPAGEGELRLSAPRIVKREAMEFRLLILRRIQASGVAAP